MEGLSEWIDSPPERKYSETNTNGQQFQEMISYVDHFMTSPKLSVECVGVDRRVALNRSVEWVGAVGGSR